MQLVKWSSSSVKKESSNDKNDADAIDNDNMSLVSMQSAATAPVGGEQKNVWHAVKHQKWWSQVATTELPQQMLQEWKPAYNIQRWLLQDESSWRNQQQVHVVS